MPRIEYYFSTISPFTYLAGPRFRRVAEDNGAEVVFKPLDVVGLFARTGGTALADRHPSRQAYRLVDLERQAKKAGLPINVLPQHHPTNAAPSSYALIAAQSAGGGDMFALSQAILTACWVDEKNIAEDAVIKECLAQTGFDPALSDSGLLSGAETYARNLEDAVAAGVFGAPSFVVDSAAPFWGQDRLEDLDLHLKGAL